MFENKITQVKNAKKLKIGQSTVSRIIAKLKKKQNIPRILYFQESLRRLLALIL
jgi:predicted transcriptional regulator